MKRIFFGIILTLIASINTCWGFKNDFFQIKSLDSFKSGAEIQVIIEDDEFSEEVRDVDMWVGDIQLNKKSADGDKHIFRIPSNAKLDMNNLKTKLKIQGRDFMVQDWPYLVNLDLASATGGGEAKVIGKFGDNCKLILSDGTSLKIKSENDTNNQTVNLPDNFDEEIFWAYLDCDDMFSNQIDINLSSPQLLYVMGVDKTEIMPGDEIIIHGQNIKTYPNADIVLHLDGDKVETFDWIDNNTIKMELPEVNLGAVDLQIFRDEFESDKLEIVVQKAPVITNVTFENEGSQRYIRLLGDFDLDLGDLEVEYNGKEMNVHRYKSDEIWIDFPQIEYDDDDENDFECDYELSQGYVTVKIGQTESNGFYLGPQYFPKIISVTKPYCNYNGCFLEFRVDGINNDKLKIYLDNHEQELDYNREDQIFRIKLQDLRDAIQPTQLYLKTNECLQSNKYGIDFEYDFMPKISNIKGINNFRPVSTVQIYGTNLTTDGSDEEIDVQVDMDPDYIAEDEDGDELLSIEYNEIELTLSDEAVMGEEVEVQVSTKYGKSNKAIFEVNGENNYAGFPIIESIKYPDGGAGGDNLEISGVGFEGKCSDNKIIFGDVVIYPYECSTSQLFAKIPENYETDEISVKNKQGNESETYDLNSTIGGEVVNPGEFDIYSKGYKEILDMMPYTTSKKKPDIKISLGASNTISDIYIPTLEFYLKGSALQLLSEPTLYVGGDEDQYFYDKQNDKLVKTKDKMVGEIKRVSNDTYKLIFHDVYIPYNKKSIDMEIRSYVYNTAPDGEKLEIMLPEGEIRYYNIHSEPNIQRKDFSEQSLGYIKIQNPKLKCYDISKDYEHCSYVMGMGGGDNQDDENDKDETTQEPDKYTKIAMKLNQEIIDVLNTKLDAFLDKILSKYDEDDYSYLAKLVKTMNDLKQGAKYTDIENRTEYVKDVYRFILYYNKFRAQLKN